MLKRLFGAIIPSSPDPDVIRARESAYQDAFGSNVQILHSTAAGFSRAIAFVRHASW